MKKIFLLLLIASPWFVCGQSFQVDVKVLLEGPYFNNEMTPFLNVFGYLPETQPYSGEPWNYEGTESVTAIPNSDVVDWALLELRQASVVSEQDSIIAQKAVILLRSGKLADLDGSSLPQINATVSGDLYAVIWHRNHLGVMSAYPMTLNGGVYSYDFTDAEDKAHGGTLGHKQVDPGVWAMIGGDGNADGYISNPDKLDVWVLQAGQNGYLSGDFDMNGQVDNTDKIEVWVANTGYSSQVPTAIYTIWSCGKPFVDTRDGQLYEMVKIGDQCWMAENLNIGQMIVGTQYNQFDNGVLEKFCYDNLQANCDTFGGLYQWGEIMQYLPDSASQGICPDGWYLPTDHEWKVLEGFADSQFQIGDPEWNNTGWRGFDVGINLKSNTTWNQGGNGNDLYGFTIMAAGRRDDGYYFTNKGQRTYFWTSCSTGSSGAWARMFASYDDRSDRWYRNKYNAFSVRCIKEPLQPSWSCGDTLTDARDGQKYTTVQIGEQCWMAENLNIGVQIDGSLDQQDNGTIEKYCYGNDQDRCSEYGGLYQWDEVMEYSVFPGSKGICPEGWHVPTDLEFLILEGTVDSQFEIGDPEWFQWGFRGLDAGGNLKETGTVHWLSPNTGATNSSGFTGLGAGFRQGINGFYNLKYTGHYWSSIQSNNSYALERYLSYHKAEVNRRADMKNVGVSVRCINDYDNSPPDAPHSPVPANGSQNIDVDTVLIWSCSDPDGELLSYKVYFGLEPDPPLVEFYQTDTVFDPGVLLYDTTYYWKIVSVDLPGDSTEGPIWSFTTKPEFECGDSLLDERDGQVYGTVQIGNKCWMSENLNIGTRINGANNQTNNQIIEKYCYNDIEDSCDVYGGLYQWNEMMQYITDTASQGICPSGWHIPTDFEWKVLEGTVDSQFPVGDPEWNGTGWRGYDAGNNLKSNYGWYMGGNGSDMYGFTAIPAGDRFSDGTFHYIIEHAFMWTSTETSGTTAWFHEMRWDQNGMWRWSWDKNWGMSIRCIQGEYQWECGDSLTDNRDGQKYGTVQIGDQCWMGENLNIGTMIIGSSNQTNNGTIEKYCYDNNTSNCDEYGGLYQWHEMMQYVATPGIQGVCPPDWHIPTDEEWKKLEGEVDSQYGYPNPEWDGTGWRGYDAGGNLKETGTTHWLSPNMGATNSSGFTALPGGAWGTNGVFVLVNNYGFWWSSSEYQSSTAWHRSLSYNSTKVNRTSNYEYDGFSVRCLRDATQSNQPPNSPSNPYPANGSTNIGADTTLSWSCSDPDGDLLTYDVYFGDSNPPPLVSPGQPDTMYTPGILEYDTIYYWRIVAFDIHGDSTEGQAWSFTTKPEFECGDPLLDERAGQVYGTVQIGNQCWMQQNLNIGTRIDGANNQTDNQIIEKYCYNDIEDSCDVYGGLFQWEELMQYVTDTATQGICPAGWYIPTDFDWKVLEGNVDSQYGVGDPEWNGTGWRGNDAGGNLKHVGLRFWNPPNTGATNSAGFSALAAGVRNHNTNSFDHLGIYGYFWTSDLSGSSVWNRALGNSDIQVYRYITNKATGKSIRCIKEPEQPSWSCGDSLHDTRDGQRYTTVQIGNQCWMAENLNIGSRIDGENIQTDNQIIEKYCYDNDSSYCNEYGGLYLWDEMMQYVSLPGIKGICPLSWHIPTDEEWKILEGEVDSQYGYPDPEWDQINWRGFDVGGSLKETGTTHWLSPNLGATNLSGFTALPAGFHDTDGTYDGIATWGNLWTSSEYNGISNWCRSLSYQFQKSSRTHFSKNVGLGFGFSVRCVKD